jgi:hypothetical protein
MLDINLLVEEWVEEEEVEVNLLLQLLKFHSLVLLHHQEQEEELLPLMV